MRRLPVSLVLAAATLILAGLADHAIAQSPLGIGTAEPSIAAVGPFAEWLQWINGRQQAFYRSMTTALKGMRDDGGQAWLLVGLSFVYGIFHAAGPGHGKVVISSYMLANEVALRRGILISFLSSLLQALTAIVVIGAVYLLLRGTSISMTDATWSLELASYALIAAFGGFLLMRKLTPVAKAFALPRARTASAGGATGQLDALFDGPDWRTETDRCTDSATQGKGFAGHCAACGRSHAADPSLLASESFDLRSGWTAIVAVGLRPCSGALIVLSFALLNGLWLGGLISVLAMALGTAITVSVLAILAVTAKDLALRLSGDGGRAAAVRTTIEIVGALALLLIGLSLFAASLTGQT